MIEGRVTIQDLRFERGGREILKGISLEVRPGQVAAVVGPNGAGKSTLLKVISGYLRPASGSVRVGGVDPASLRPSMRSRLVTYSGDEPVPAFAFTVEETVEMGRVASEAAFTRGRLVPDSPCSAASRGRYRFHSSGGGHPVSESPRNASRPRERLAHSGLGVPGPGRLLPPHDALQAALEALQLTNLRDRAITSLSSGERQRVYLARAVYQDPLVLLLDEPTTHLDMAYEVHVAGMIRELAGRGKTVITVVHDLNLALRCAERLFFLKEGELRYSVAPEEVSPEIIGDIYDAEVQIVPHPVLGTPYVTPPSGRKAP